MAPVSEDGYSFEKISIIGSNIFYIEKPYFGGERIVNPGNIVRGWIAFDVPFDKKLKYTSIYDFISCCKNCRH